MRPSFSISLVCVQELDLVVYHSGYGLSQREKTLPCIICQAHTQNDPCRQSSFLHFKLLLLKLPMFTFILCSHISGFLGLWCWGKCISNAWTHGHVYLISQLNWSRSRQQSLRQRPSLRTWERARQQWDVTAIVGGKPRHLMADLCVHCSYLNSLAPGKTEQNFV